MAAPVNVGLNNQQKLGKLVLNTDLSNPYAIGLEVFGDANFYGTVKVADTGDVCNTSSSGRIRFDGTNFFGCTGASIWEQLTSATPAPTSFTWTISADTTNFNMANAFGLTQPRDIILTINSGVIVSSTNTGTPALSTGNLPAGSTLTIINNGTIVGFAGAGGAGGDVQDGTIGTARLTSGKAGGSGGDAIFSSLPIITIDNSRGTIAAGGGGGGGGGAAVCRYYLGPTDGGSTLCATGGGGGGAGGKAIGAGGYKGVIGKCSVSYSNTGTPNGTSGISGTVLLGGNGGNGGNTTDGTGTATAGAGGAGGDAGVNGASGSPAANSGLCNDGNWVTPSGSGGSAGSQVVGTVNWI